MPPSILILGAGISGLATAWFQHQQGAHVLLLESRDRCGGNLRTSLEQGYLFEHGPNSTLQKAGTPEDALGRLVQQLGLEDVLLAANPLATRRFILKNGQLAALPASPPAFLTTRIFSLKAKLRLLAEPFLARGQEEESIARFVTRRLGQEFLDYAIEPFISGVYAGNPATLSVQAAVPKIHQLEQKYGSLIRGALAMGQATKGAGLPKGRLVSFHAGMETLPRTIASRLPNGTLQTGARIQTLEPLAGHRWRVHWLDAGGHSCSREGDHLVLSLPTLAAADLIAPWNQEAAAVLRTIPYAPIASVALGWPRSRVQHRLDGFGFLIPRREGVTTLGALFSSTLFPRRAPDGHVLLTAFIGGAMHAEVMNWTDQSLVDRVVADLTPCLGITGDPAFVAMTRYTHAIPQYTLGHLQRLARFDQAMADHPTLHVRANWRDGISVADCVRNAEKRLT